MSGLSSVDWVPLTYLYCEDDKVAELLLALHRLSAEERNRKVEEFLGLMG